MQYLIAITSSLNGPTLRTLNRSLLTLVLLSVPLSARADDPAPTIEQVAARMARMEESRLAALRNYTVTRRYVIDNSRFQKHAEMTARMTFTSPGKKEFEILSESGSSWIRKRVIRKMIEAEIETAQDALRASTRITPENYQFRFLGVQTEGGRSFYVLEATPRTENKYLFRGRVWLDVEDAAVARIEGSPAQPPSFWTRDIHFTHRYEKFGPFWLPVSNHSETQVRVFGLTVVDIRYLDYRINQPHREKQRASQKSAISTSSDPHVP